jgi:hypothetical protein
MAEVTGLPIWFGEGQDFVLPLSITKIDPVKRTVDMVGTSEKDDKQGDAMDYGGSVEAFATWAGNIREMHQPKAVGKRVYQEFDNEAKLVRVGAYISTGAEDTWQKILDGTLRGASIGGKALETVKEVRKLADGTEKSVRRVLKYQLNELSLVDNPANPDCVITLVKMAEDGSLTQTEVVEEVQKGPLDMLPADRTASVQSVYLCPACGYRSPPELIPADKHPIRSCPDCSEVLMVVQNPHPNLEPSTVGSNNPPQVVRERLQSPGKFGVQPDASAAMEAELLGVGPLTGAMGPEDLLKGWLPEGTTQTDLDDGDFLALSDKYKAGEASKSEGRKLPYKVHGSVSPEGWMAAYKVLMGGHGGAELGEGWPSKEECLSKLEANKPKGIEKNPDGTYSYSEGHLGTARCKGAVGPAHPKRGSIGERDSIRDDLTRSVVVRRYNPAKLTLLEKGNGVKIYKVGGPEKPLRWITVGN